MFYGLSLSLIIINNMWDDEVMWDIRNFMMGSRLEKLPGFPQELYDIREKLYITRDGVSESRQKARLD